MITIDVETYFAQHRVLPFVTNVHGRLQGHDYGIGKIMEICNRYGAKATFFVDVYEHYRFGKEALKETCLQISESGHDVQLHAHPNFIPWCTEGGLMKRYPFHVQKEIVTEGRELIGEWVGKPPTGFRGGAYGVNALTLKALEESGFTVDSSYFAYHENCDLSAMMHNVPKNRPFMIGNILELPVTTYDLIDVYFWKKNSKIDMNACTLVELIGVVNKILASADSTEKGLETVILFLHSFSFIRWNAAHTTAEVNWRVLTNFEKLLMHLARFHKNEVEFVTVSDIDAANVKEANQRTASDYVPTGNVFHLIPRYLKRFETQMKMNLEERPAAAGGEK